VIVAGIVVLIAAAMFVFELRYPGRSLPKVRGWWWRAAVLNGMQGAMVFIAGSVWDGWMLERRPWATEGLGAIGGAFAGYFAITFVFYWWHRYRHTVPILWRVFHQVHHSPGRIEVVTSFYKHPLEVLVNSVLSSAILYFLVGLSPEAAVGAILLSGLAELFYHWNVRTPYWIGFLFQRPESHCVHHERGVHFRNFSDLPIWDMMFGTFHNPREFDSKCGFEPEQERRLGRMLLAFDVLAAPQASMPDVMKAAEWSPDAPKRQRRWSALPLAGGNR
jgi:sterol desaturase/sphingolipid hydroxylase (fatty acid hydroxylase superfamily)